MPEIAMRLTIDKEADALYLRLDEKPVVESEEVQPGVILDYNEKNQVVGVEILRLRQRVPEEALKSVVLSST